MDFIKLKVNFNLHFLIHIGAQMRLAQIDRVKCGYYGWKGANTILKTIQGIFRGKHSLLTIEKTKPQSVFDYMQTVLVPEIAIRLIAQDQKLDMNDPNHLKQAHQILDNSSEFGTCIYGDLSDSDMEDDQFVHPNSSWN